MKVSRSCMVVAPLVLLASSAVSPSLKSDQGEQLAVIARHPDRYYLFIVLGLVGTGLLIPAVLGLMLMLGKRTPVSARIGGGLALVGTVLAMADWGSELVKWQMAAPGANRAAMTTLLKRFDETAGSALPLQISGFAVLVGIVVLAIGLYRARAMAAWTAAGLIVWIVLNIVGFAASSVALLIGSSAVLVVTLGWIGRRVPTESGAEWEHTPEGPHIRPAAGTP